MRFIHSALALALLFSSASAARAATFVVDRTDDDGAATTCSTAANDCSLRGAINKANTTPGADNITFDAAVADVITLRDEPLQVRGELSIDGPGHDKLSLRRSEAGPLFQVAPDSRVTVSDLRFVKFAARTGATPVGNDGVIEQDATDLQPKSEATKELLERAKTERAVRRTRVVRLDTDALAEQSAVELPLFPGVLVRAQQNRVEFRGPKDYTWFGSLTGKGGGDTIISVQGGRVSANIEAPFGRTYQMRSVGEGLTAVQEIDQLALPECGLSPGHEPISVPHSAQVRGPGAWGNGPAKGGALGNPQADGALQIDVMVVYTAAAAASVPNINSEIQAGIDDTNNSFANSGITVRMRLVHAEQINYAQSGSIFTDIDRLQNPNDGYMDEVHTLRNTYKADLVSLWISDSADACGLGYLPGTVAPTNDNLGFTVIVAPNCAVSNHSFAHELGHNMSAHHDRYVDSSDNAPFHHGYGYTDPTHGFRTVMAYNDACAAQGVNCTRLAAFSNADRTSNGFATGVPDSQPNAADNRLTLNKSALAVANYRDASGVTPALVVTKLADTDDGACSYDDCSLREAIAASPTGGTIQFQSGLTGTITLNSGLQILRDLTIQGPTNNAIAISYQSGDNGSVFYTANSRANLSNLTIVAAGASNYGIYGTGTVAVSNCTLRGGAFVLINAGGALTARNSTITGGNTGLYCTSATTVANCTITGNAQLGIYNNGGTVNLSNSIVAGNGTNLNGALATNTNNITSGTAAAVGLDPAGLKDNGGPTQTVALVPGSPAINMGDPSFNGSGQFDQRGAGFARVSGGRLDIGAFEVQAANRAPTLNNATYSTSANVSYTQQLGASDADGDTLSYALASGALPPGLSLGGATGLLSGTPTQSGRFDFSVSVTDGRGGIVTAKFIIIVSAASDGIGPLITRSGVPTPVTRDALASSTLTGTIRDVAPNGVTPTGVRLMLFQIRRNSDGFSYSGPTDGFTSNTNRGYYPGTLGASSDGTTGGTRNFSRSLSWLPDATILVAGDYTFNVIGQDNAGNWSVEVVPLTIIAPSAADAPTPPNTQSAKFG